MWKNTELIHTIWYFKKKGWEEDTKISSNVKSDMENVLNLDNREKYYKVNYKILWEEKNIFVFNKILKIKTDFLDKEIEIDWKKIKINSAWDIIEYNQVQYFKKEKAKEILESLKWKFPLWWKSVSEMQFIDNETWWCFQDLGWFLEESKIKDENEFKEKLKYKEGSLFWWEKETDDKKNYFFEKDNNRFLFSESGRKQYFFPIIFVLDEKNAEKMFDNNI